MSSEPGTQAPEGVGQPGAIPPADQTAPSGLATASPAPVPSSSAGRAASGGTGALREDQVQNAVAFLSHPKVSNSGAES